MKLNDLILIVDDENDICEEIGEYLKMSHLKSITAPNGKIGFEKVIEHHPIVVITDYQMPVMNGMELLKKVKQFNNLIQVIFISGHADIKIIVKAIKDQAFDFLYKPVDLNELVETIKQAIDRSKSESYKFKNAIKLRVNHDIKYIDDIPYSLIEINSPLDENTRDLINQDMKKIYSEHLEKHVVIDLSMCQYINNVGLNLLIEVFEELSSKEHKIGLSNLTNFVENYLKTLGYYDFFNCTINIENAVKILINR